MTKRRKKAGASGSPSTPEPVAKDAVENQQDAARDAREAFAEETSADAGAMGDAMETRVRHRKDERLRLDALDDIEVSMDRDDLPADAVDEIAMSETTDEYETVDSGDRRARRDEAEMGFGGEAHSPEEIADQVLGREIPGRRGRTRDGEAHGPPELGLE